MRSVNWNVVHTCLAILTTYGCSERLLIVEDHGGADSGVVSFDHDSTSDDEQSAHAHSTASSSARLRRGDADTQAAHDAPDASDAPDAQGPLDEDALDAGPLDAMAPLEPDTDPEPDAQPLRLALAGGEVLGKQVGETREFLGIRYAKAPVGNLRFAPPQPVARWDGTFDATHFGPGCPQMSLSFASPAETGEDCLNLNVYAPLRASSLLPVLVFIHGGGFVTGANSEYNGEILSGTRSVVVTINYRLGALGFFSSSALDATRTDAPSGSDAIRDQRLALRWVTENIQLFGGDPNNVTVVGESAGAISACIHYVSPESRRLAQRFIIQSGSCTYDAFSIHYKTTANTLGEQLTAAMCPGAEDVIACLRSKSAQDLVDWGIDDGLFGPGWLPTIEGRGGVLTDVPERLIAEADALPPLIIGTNKREWGLYQQLGAAMPATRDKYDSALARQFGAEAASVMAQYPIETDSQANETYVELVSDVSYRCPARSVALLASGRGANVRMYSFEAGTALHSQELDYVFGGDAFSTYGGGMPNSELQSQVQRYWTRFARDGDPNGDDDAFWPPYDVNDDQYLVLDSRPSVGSGLARSRCEFWRDYVLRGGTISLD